MCAPRPGSSAVEQQTHNLSCAGSNPARATASGLSLAPRSGARLLYALRDGAAASATILGQGVSSLGVTLALLITFLVIVGGLVNVLVLYIVGQVAVEHKQNQERRQKYLS